MLHDLSTVVSETNVPRKIPQVELKGQMCLLRFLEIYTIFNIVCNSMSCSNVKRIFLSFVKKKYGGSELWTYLLLSPEWQTLIFCHFACTYSSEILEAQKRAKQQSDVIFPSIFLMHMENSQPLSCSVYKTLAEDCITFALFFSPWDMTELQFKLTLLK